jgi:uncharacterized protein YdaU (DUF1376 family)
VIETGLELPFIQVFVKDYIGTVSHLPLDAQGAYWRLVLYQWKHQAIPGDDLKTIANILGVGTRDASRLFRLVGPLFELRTLDGQWQSGYWTSRRADAERLARANRAKAEKAARGRWNTSSTPRNASSNAPSIPLSTLGDASSNAPSIKKYASSTDDQTLDLSSGNDQRGVVGRSQAENTKNPTPPASSTPDRRGTLIPRGGVVQYDRQMTAKHAGCHPEICIWSNAGTSRRCMPAAQVTELAAKTSLERTAAVEDVIAWANADRPPADYVAPSSDFEHWRRRWDATRATPPQKAQDAPQAAPSSTVPALDPARREKYFGGQP